MWWPFIRINVRGGLCWLALGGIVGIAVGFIDGVLVSVFIGAPFKFNLVVAYFPMLLRLLLTRISIGSATIATVAVAGNSSSVAVIAVAAAATASM